jgi:hypothetical protein
MTAARLKGVKRSVRAFAFLVVYERATSPVSVQRAARQKVFVAMCRLQGAGEMHLPSPECPLRLLWMFVQNDPSDLLQLASSGTT